MDYILISVLTMFILQSKFMSTVLSFYDIKFNVFLISHYVLYGY